MCLSLYDYQAKASRYRKALTYLKNRATTNQNQTIHSQTLKRKGHKHKRKSSNQKKKKKKKERNKGEKKKQRENKVYHGNKYIFINSYLKCQWAERQSGRLDQK